MNKWGEYRLLGNINKEQPLIEWLVSVTTGLELTAEDVCVCPLMDMSKYLL